MCILTELAYKEILIESQLRAEILSYREMESVLFVF